MRKILRGIAALLGVALLGAAAAILALVRPLDASPERTETARSEAVARIQAERPGAGAFSAHPLLAGWAQRDITPAHPVPLAGYGARRGALSEGVSFPLHCRVLALQAGEQTLVLVALDTLLVPDAFGRSLRHTFHRETGLPPASLFLAPSHTHSAPDLWDNPVAALVTGGGYCPDYSEFVHQSVLSAAREALADLKPAEWAWGRDWAPDQVRNRARDAPLDAWLEWLAVRKVGQEAFGLVVNFSAHATVFGSSHRKVDADYPGRLTAALEAGDRVEIALFQAGALGSASPQPPHDSRSEGRSARAKALGTALAGHVGALREEPRWNPEIALDAALVEIPLPPFQFRLGIGDWVLAPWVARRVGFEKSADLHIARLDTLRMIGLPVELSAEISLDLKEMLPRDVNLWVVSNATGFYGYVSPDAWYGRTDVRRRKAYEASTMAFLGPHAEQYIRALIHAASGVKNGEG